MQTADRIRGAGRGALARFVVGDWQVDTAAQELRRAGERVAIEPRQMAVLAALCRNPGQLMSSEALLNQCWPDEPSGDNPIHKAIAHLRRVLGDSATAPRYIETIRKQGYRLIAPTSVVLDDGVRSHRGAWGEASPFCGLEAFDATRASVFFGRDGAVALLRARLRLQWLRGDPLVLLLGPSGSGKTSLVQAGLLPALAMGHAPAPRAAPAQDGGTLRACAAAVVDLGSLDDSGAWQALAGGLLDWEVDGLALFSGYSIYTLTHALSRDPGTVLRTLRANLAALACDASHAPPLLVIDRLEALFQPPLASHANAVVEVIEALVDSGLVMVLCICRNDFYAGLAAHRLFMRGRPFGSHVDLEAPDAEALSQIVRLPARAAGLTYGTDPSGLHRLDDRLCADAMQAPDALPLLQYTLHALYQARAPGGLMTWDAYDALGGLEGAIGQRAEAVLAALPSGQQDALAQLLPRLVTCAPEGGGTTGRWARESDLVGDDEVALARALVTARLLVADRIAGVACIRIAHEALLRRWPRALTWIAQHRGMLAARDELLPWLRRWEDGGHAPSLLLPGGATLWRAAEVAASAPQLFSDRERGFVARSQRRVRRLGRLRRAAALGALLLRLAALAALQEADVLLDPLQPAAGPAMGDHDTSLGARACWQAQIASGCGDVDEAWRQMARYRIACERWRADAPKESRAAAECGVGVGVGVGVAGLGAAAFRRGDGSGSDVWFERARPVPTTPLGRSRPAWDGVARMSTSSTSHSLRRARRRLACRMSTSRSNASRRCPGRAPPSADTPPGVRHRRPVIRLDPSGAETFRGTDLPALR